MSNRKTLYFTAKDSLVVYAAEQSAFRIKPGAYSVDP